MNLSLLVQLVGFPLFVALCVLSSILTCTALFLALKIKQIPLLAAFFPLNIVPIMAGLVSTVIAVVTSIGISQDSTITSEPGLLLLLSVMPLLAGCLAAVPSALVVIIARWVLTWKASGVRLFPEKPNEGNDPADDHAKWKKDEADAYVRDLVRPR